MRIFRDVHIGCLKSKRLCIMFSKFTPKISLLICLLLPDSALCIHSAHFQFLQFYVLILHLILGSIQKEGTFAFNVFVLARGWYALPRTNYIEPVHNLRFLEIGHLFSMVFVYGMVSPSHPFLFNLVAGNSLTLF